jgi:hypothetical protein
MPYRKRRESSARWWAWSSGGRASSASLLLARSLDDLRPRRTGHDFDRAWWCSYCCWKGHFSHLPTRCRLLA